MPSVQEIYEQSRHALSASERFELATLLLKDISLHSVVDYSTEWSEEDLQDFTRSGQMYIERIRDEE